MCSILITILSSIVLGAISSFVVWVIPAEKFEPNIRIVLYNQRKVTDYVKNTNGKTVKRLFLKRTVHIVNDSPQYAAYNMTCFAELLDDNNNIVYREEKKIPIVKANTSETDAIVLPFERLPIDKLKKANVVKIEINLVYENRYGTKKTTGSWWIRSYNLEKNTFEPELEI